MFQNFRELATIYQCLIFFYYYQQGPTERQGWQKPASPTPLSLELLGSTIKMKTGWNQLQAQLPVIMRNNKEVLNGLDSLTIKSFHNHRKMFLFTYIQNITHFPLPNNHDFHFVCFFFCSSIYLISFSFYFRLHTLFSLLFFFSLSFVWWLLKVHRHRWLCILFRHFFFFLMSVPHEMCDDNKIKTQPVNHQQTKDIWSLPAA